MAVAIGLVLLGACNPTTPAPLPSGATQLQLLTQAPPGINIGPGGCPTALMSPVRVQRSGDVLSFVDATTGERRRLSWPAGFSARVLDGRAELITPLGNVYAREGDVLSNLIGGAGDNADMLVRFASSDEYKNGPPLP